MRSCWTLASHMQTCAFERVRDVRCFHCCGSAGVVWCGETQSCCAKVHGWVMGKVGRKAELDSEGSSSCGFAAWRRQATNAPTPSTCVNGLSTGDRLSNHDTLIMATDLYGCATATLTRKTRTCLRIALRSQIGRLLAQSLSSPVSRSRTSASPLPTIVRSGGSRWTAF